nr:reverse transcriptase domain-containing protein [Tanacetum cinerariifolium]
SRADPTLLNDFEMAAEGNGDPPVPDLRTLEELCQPSLNGRLENSCQFHGLSNDDANKHLDKFLHVTQSIKVNGVTDDALCLYLFPYSLTHHATAWFDRLLRNSINTFEQMAKMYLGKYFPPSMVTKVKNEITNFRQRPDESLFEAWKCYMLSIDRCPNHNMLSVTQIDTFYNGLTLRHRDTINAAAGGTFMKRRPEEYYYLIENMTAHHNDWDTSAQRTTVGQTQNVYAIGAYKVVTTNEFTNYVKANDAILKNMKTNMTSLIYSNLELKNMFGQFMKMNTASSSGSGTLPSNIITNPKEDLKGITTHSGTAYQGPTIPTTSSYLPLVVKRETKVTKDPVHPTNNESTKNVQPPVVQAKTLILNSEPVIAPIIEPVVAPLPEKLGDPGKFLIPCDFPRMDECLALADLEASINLMPLSVWNKLSLPELSTTCMTLELADRLISRPVGVAEDVFVKVGTFHFPTNFIVVDFDADPRVPLILERYFLKSGRVSIDMFEGELTFRIVKEAITFNLDQTSRYSANYNDMTANQINVIDMDCEEYSESDFLLEEVNTFLALEDDPTSPKVDHSYFDPDGDILILEAFLNDDPSLPLLIKEITCLKLCNAPGTLQRCMMAIFHDMIEKAMEVFMDEFSVFGNSFQTCFSHLEKMLKRCGDTNLCLN